VPVGGVSLSVDLTEEGGVLFVLCCQHVLFCAASTCNLHPLRSCVCEVAICAVFKTPCLSGTMLFVVVTLASKGFGRAARHNAHVHARIARSLQQLHSIPQREVAHC
jgi:hypothetical protein